MSNYDNIQSFSSGIGTDLFIKKNKPGHAVGDGYTIEIFTNGVKTEEIHKKQKKDVIDLLKEYKMQYNTDRAFQNQVQYHVTYKTKEQRGEAPYEENKVFKNKYPDSEQKPDIKDIQDINPKQEEAKAMASIEQTLLKQATDIERVLQRLLSPDMPVKVREAADDILNSNTLPDPSPQETAIPDSFSPENLANTLAGKILQYMSSKPDIPVDEAYNNIKSWIAQVRKKIDQWESSSDGKVDKKTMLKNVKTLIFESDPQSLASKLKVEVTPEILKKTQDILAKSASYDETRKFDSIDKVTSYLNTLEDGDSNEDVVVIQTIKDMDPEVIQSQIKDFVGKDDKNYSERKFENVLTNFLKEENVDIKKLLGPMLEDVKKDLKLASIYFDYIEKEKQNYFRYASVTKGSYTPEEIFENFIENRDLTYDDAKFVWAKIQDNLIGTNSAFSDLISFVFAEQVTSKKAFHALQPNEVSEIMNKNQSFSGNIVALINSYRDITYKYTHGTNPMDIDQFLSNPTIGKIYQQIDGMLGLILIELGKVSLKITKEKNPSLTFKELFNEAISEKDIAMFTNRQFPVYVKGLFPGDVPALQPYIQIISKKLMENFLKDYTLDFFKTTYLFDDAFLTELGYDPQQVRAEDSGSQYQDRLQAKTEEAAQQQPPQQV